MKTKNILFAALVQIISMSASAPAWAQMPANYPLWIANDSTFTVVEIYASPSTTPDWGRDHLGIDVISRGNRFLMRLPQGDCTYDIRVNFSDVHYHVLRRVDFCQLSGIRVYNNRLDLVRREAAAEGRAQATPEAAVRTAEQVLERLRRLSGVDVRPDGSVVFDPRIAKSFHVDSEGRLVIIPQDSAPAR
jgi:hypothetical protein